MAAEYGKALRGSVGLGWAGKRAKDTAAAMATHVAEWIKLIATPGPTPEPHRTGRCPSPRACPVRSWYGLCAHREAPFGAFGLSVASALPQT